MRSLIVMAMFVATFSNAAWNGYSETRDLEVSADGVELLEIDAGAGNIVVNGDANATSIKVKAVIRVDDDEKDARRLIDKDLVLKLETKHGKARLDSYFEQNFWHNDGAAVDLDVHIPQGLAIFVDDGSGSMHIEGVLSNVGVDDGSGGIDVADVEHDLDSIDYGNGSVQLADIRGAVKQND